jgi:hypothetical protein
MKNVSNEEIANRHAHHAPKEKSTIETHAKVRNLVTLLAQELNEIVPEGREKALMLTKLDEARMWANAAVAIHLE